MKTARLLYLLLFLSPVAFLCGYIAGAPKGIQAPRLHFEGVDTRHLRPQGQDYLDTEGSLIIGDSARLAPNRDLEAR